MYSAVGGLRSGHVFRTMKLGLQKLRYYRCLCPPRSSPSQKPNYKLRAHLNGDGASRRYLIHRHSTHFA